MNTGRQRNVSRPRLLVAYLLLALLTATGATFALVVGSGKRAEPEIAGGYDVTAGASCLATTFDLAQSGRFVSISDSAGSLNGELTWRNGRLSGSIGCVDGARAPLEAEIHDGVLAGRLRAHPVRAVFRRDPPSPGVPSPAAPKSVNGDFSISPPSLCLGTEVHLSGSGSRVDLESGRRRLGVLGYDRQRGGALIGRIACLHGGRRRIAGAAADRSIDLLVASPRARIRPGGPVSSGAEHVTATKTRDLTSAIQAFFLAVIVVMLFSRLLGSLMPRISQPRVMGEVLAGILLGPTLLGAISPQLEAALFPSDIVPYIGIAANLGLIFYMFLVGLEIDLTQTRAGISRALAVSNAGVALPMVAGMLVAIPVYGLVAPQINFAGFALFMGVSMSITAFPVLARIIVERRMVKRPLGALALAAAAIDDVTAWLLVALATSIAVAGSSSGAVPRTIALTIVFCLLMWRLGRPLLSRAAVAYDELGGVPAGWITLIFAGVLLSAYATESIGIALIFGAFVMGLSMPRHAGLTEDVTRRVEDFVVVLLLPLFFAFTGLRTNVLELGRPELVALTAALCVVAVGCKFGGTTLAARITGLSWRESSVLGTLMNTRGLTELIVLNLAVDKGVISSALFSALVLMALLTTFMTGPLLRLLDPRGEFSASPEQELETARAKGAAEAELPVPERSILLAPQSAAAVRQLCSLAEPLARSEPPRELILARFMEPPPGVSARGGLQTESRLLGEAATEIYAVREALLGQGVPTRAAVFSSVEPGRDLVRLCERAAVDLLLLDGRRPLFGAGVPRGKVGTVLERAPCDVGVLVTREDSPVPPGPAAPVLVPFGGAEHDWAALELGAWIASTTDAPLQLLGRGEDDGRGQNASRLLANASLLVQRFVGIAAEPLIAAGGRDGVIEAAAGAGLLLIGLAEEWKSEGLGETRAAIARAAPAPILFVRRGTRPGALAPPTDVTRFSWSSASVAARRAAVS